MKTVCCIEFVLNGIFSTVILIMLHNEKNLSFLKIVSGIKKKILQRCVKIEAPKSHHLDKTGNTRRFFIEVCQILLKITYFKPEASKLSS